MQRQTHARQSPPTVSATNKRGWFYCQCGQYLDHHVHALVSLLLHSSIAKGDRFGECPPQFSRETQDFRARPKNRQNSKAISGEPISINTFRLRSCKELDNLPL